MDFDRIAKDKSIIEAQSKRIQDLEAELQEQARLNGMGSEREARLMAIIEEQKRELASKQVQVDDKPIGYYGGQGIISWLGEYSMHVTSKPKKLLEGTNLYTSNQIARAWIEVENFKRELASKQALIDALMLEYCPEDMTPEQVQEWERHQVSVGK